MWGEVSNWCRGEASKGARCPRGRDVQGGEMSIGARCLVPLSTPPPPSVTNKAGGGGGD